METIKIRASSASKLMTQSKNELTETQQGKLIELQSKDKLTEKQQSELDKLIYKRDNPEPSESLKTCMDELWLKKVYGYYEELTTPMIVKGKMVENESMGLVVKVLGGEFRHQYKTILEAKGIKYLEDEYFTGTPDIVLNDEDYVEDIKTSWDIKTFHNADLEDSYYWQAQVYLHLTGKKNYRLIYCLMPTPDEFILSMKNKVFYALHCDKEQVASEDYEKAAKQIEWNHRDMILKMPEKDRIKFFEFKYEPEKIELLKKQVVKAREYYKTIKL